MEQIIKLQNNIVCKYQSAIDSKDFSEKEVRSIYIPQEERINIDFLENKRPLEKEANDKLKEIEAEKESEIKKLENWKDQKLASSKEEFDDTVGQLETQHKTLLKYSETVDNYIKKKKWNELILKNNQKGRKKMVLPEYEDDYQALCNKEFKKGKSYFNTLKKKSNTFPNPFGNGFYVLIWTVAFFSGYIVLAYRSVSAYRSSFGDKFLILVGLLIFASLLTKSAIAYNKHFIEKVFDLFNTVDSYKILKDEYLKTLRNKYSIEQKETEQVFNNSLKAITLKYVRIQEGVKNNLQSKINELNHSYSPKFQSISLLRNKEFNKINIGFKKATKEFRNDIDKINSLFLKWEDNIKDYSYILNEYPKGFKIGNLYKKYKNIDISLPAIIPFPINQPIVYNASASHKNFIINNIYSLLLRLLLRFQPTKVKFIFFDPMDLGKNVGPFLNLLDYDENIIHNQAVYESNHIEKNLVRLTEKMALVTQKFLRNQFETLEEYNLSAGNLSEPYEILVVFDFPVGFTKEMMARFNNIVKNGPKCGIYPIIIFDDLYAPDEKNEFGKWLDNSIQIFGSSTEKSFSFSYFNDFSLSLESAPDQIGNIINQVGKACVENKGIVISFEKLLESANISKSLFWSYESTKELIIPIGLIGTSKHQNIVLGNGTSQHILIGGKTGSGKSSLFHTIITSSCIKYSPNELNLYLIDFKKGVEFKRYATSKLPHAPVIAIESEREFGLSVLENIDEEIRKRGDLFRNNGVDGFKEFRLKTKESLPRLLIMIDEYQEFFSVENDEIASKSSQILDRIVRQGRAFGIHLILGSQTIAGSYNISRSTLDQIAIRIALQSSEEDSRLILGSDNPAARMLSRPGEAIYNALNGMTEGNYLFQVALLTDNSQSIFLNEITNLQEKKKIYPSKKQIIFEGNDLARIENNIYFVNLLNGNFNKNNKLVYSLLGDPIKIKETIKTGFTPDSGSNLLILGQSSKLSQGMMLSSVLSLGLQLNNNDTIYYLDYTSIEELNKEYIEAINNIVNTKIRYGRRKDLNTFIKEIEMHLNKQIKKDENDISIDQNIFLFINSLHRVKELNPNSYQNINSFNFSLDINENDDPVQESLNKLLSKIVIEGPHYGIHSVIWCDSYKNFNRRVERQLLQEFDMKVVSHLNTDDSINIVDSPAATSLKTNQALLLDENTGILEKFRPFLLPSVEWFESLKPLF